LISKNFEGRVVLVTGACGQLGAATAKYFAKRGALLWLIDILEAEDSEHLDLNELGNSLLGFLKMKISDEKAVQDFFCTQVKKTGLEVLVNNAGIGIFSPYASRTYAEFNSVLETNLFGTFVMTKFAIDAMSEKKSGSIINIGSIYGTVSSDPSIYVDTPRLNSEVYSASKAGVIQLAKYFAVHSAWLGVRVNTVSPGGIFLKQGPGFLEKYIEKVPMGRMGTPEDVVGMIGFLASDEATYITGQNIMVDGGFTSW
jgi:3-oxoacyl-[acyl-carrier protein] reductase